MEQVNWLPPLKNYIRLIYGKENDYEQDLDGFNKSRQDLLGVNPYTIGTKLYYKYYSQLELLDLRIPVNSVIGKKLQFVWYDAFHKTISHEQHSLPFEKANILFNIASILSKVGVYKYEQSKRSVDSGEDTTKEAIEYFQQAAGVLQFISENFLHAPSDDLSQSSLNFLNKLMLAQSQEIFVLKAIIGDLNQSKNSLIAKLCSCTSKYYSECNGMIDHNVKEGVSTSDYEVVDTNEEFEDLEDIVDEESQNPNDYKITIQLEPFWISLLTFKQIYYKSLAYYFQGLQLEAGKKFGDAIGYFTKSQQILNEISSVTLNQISKSPTNEAFEVLDNYKFHKDALSIKLTDLNKDNDLIYHDPIPSLVTLPEIKPLDSARMIPMNKIELFKEINDHNYENFLKNVVPIDIHELLSYYSEEKSQFLRNELDMVDVSNEELASVLEYLKMPKAIVNLKEIINENTVSKDSEGGISSEIILKVNEIARNYSQDTTNKENIMNLRKQIYATINEIESKSNNSMGGSQYKDEIIKLKKSLYDATNADEKLLGLINVENSKLYDILGNGSNSREFKQLFEVPSSKVNYDNETSLLDIIDTPQSNGLDSQIKKIEDILYDLNVIKANKQKLVDTLKTEIHNDDISDILVLNSKVKTNNEIKNVIFPEELKKFQPYANELDNLINKQKDFIDSLKESWDTLSSHPKVKDIQSSKTFKDTLMVDQVTRIEKFYTNNWKRYSEGLKRGGTFYGQLLSFAKSLRDKVNANDGMNERFANMNLSASSTGQNYQAPSQGQNYSQPGYAQPGYAQPGYSQGPATTGPPRPPQPYQAQISPMNTSSLHPQHTPQATPYQGYQPNYQPNQPQNHLQYQTQPQFFNQPMLQRTSTSGSSGYDRAAPSLPPKQPNYSQTAPHNGGYPQSSIPQYQSPPSNSPYGSQPPQQSHSQSQSSQNSLIYDQPSTYNPNMYNFFSKE